MLSDEIPPRVASLLGMGLIGFLLFAVVAGFFAGLLCAPWLQEHAARRSTRRLQRLMSLVMLEFERAIRMGQLLESSITSPLDAEHWKRIEHVRHQFAELWQQLADRQAMPVSSASLVPEVRVGTTAFEWHRSPTEPMTHLPDKSAFEYNLKVMLTAAAQQGLPSGVMLIRIDKAEQLMMRYGPSAAVSLQERVANVIVQAARESDLICRLSSDLFGVLLPRVSALDGIRSAENIRSAVREHSFHFEEDGPAVLVTASFGYAACLPTDPPNLVIDRAAEALDKSQATGRNQLHLHDGTSRVLAHIR